MLFFGGNLATRPARQIIKNSIELITKAVRGINSLNRRDEFMLSSGFELIVITACGAQITPTTSRDDKLTCFDSRFDSSLVDCESASTSCKNVSQAWNKLDWQGGRCNQKQF